MDSLKEHSKIRVERGVIPESFLFEEAKAEDEEGYPIEVVLRHLSEAEANPRQSTHTASLSNGTSPTTHDGMFRSNLTADDTVSVHYLQFLSSLSSVVGMALISRGNGVACCVVPS